MDLLNHTIAKITPLDKNAIDTAKKRLTQFTTPTRNFGYLENILLKYIGITSNPLPDVPKKCTIITCADHGVAAMGVSAYPVETTVQMTRNYLVSKGAVANALANFSGAHMIVVDMGIASPTEDIPGLLNRKIAFGTNNIAKGPAMTRQQALQALCTGIELANQYAAQGYQCFLPGEMGIANTTSSSAIIAVCGNLSPAQATGRGTNISDERLKLKIDVVRQALEANQPNPNDGIDLLAKVGGFELGCIAGIMLGAAANQCVVMIDGFNTGAAALVANAICPLVKHYLIGSHLAAEPAHSKMLDILELKPYINMNFRLGEATGSSIAINLLDAAIKAYHIIADTPADLSFKELALVQIDSAKKRLATYAETIRPLDKTAMEDCSLYIDNLTKPIHSLGAIETLAIQLAGITTDNKPKNPQKSLLLFSRQEKIADSTVTSFATHAHAEISLCRVPADMEQAFATGIQAVNDAVEKGKKIIGLGIFDNVQSDICHEILQAEENPYILLAKLNNPAVTAVTAAIITAAAKQTIVVLDGTTTTLAAYLATKIAPTAREYLIASQLSPKPAHHELLEKLQIPVYLDLKLTLGEGCGSALGMKLLDASLHMLNDMKTFGQAAVPVANDGPGAKRQDLKI